MKYVFVIGRWMVVAVGLVVLLFVYTPVTIIASVFTFLDEGIDDFFVDLVKVRDYLDRRI